MSSRGAERVLGVVVFALGPACGSPAEPAERPTPVVPTAHAQPAAPIVVAPVSPPERPVVFEAGFASWYGARLAGHKTASGERFDPSQMTAAHRTLKLGTWVEVTRTDTGQAVRVRVNDRGPVSHRFVIDLSSGAARRLGMLRMGVAPVALRLVSGP